MNNLSINVFKLKMVENQPIITPLIFSPTSGDNQREEVDLLFYKNHYCLIKTTHLFGHS